MLLVILFSESVAESIRLLFVSPGIVAFHLLLLAVKLPCPLAIKVALCDISQYRRQATCKR